MTCRLRHLEDRVTPAAYLAARRVLALLEDLLPVRERDRIARLYLGENGRDGLFIEWTGHGWELEIEIERNGSTGYLFVDRPHTKDEREQGREECSERELLKFLERAVLPRLES